MGIWGMTHTLVMPMGGMTMGGVASAFDAPIAVATGGSIVALFAIFGAGGSSRVRSLGRSDAAEAAEPGSPVAAEASAGERRSG